MSALTLWRKAFPNVYRSGDLRGVGVRRRYAMSATPNPVKLTSGGAGVVTIVTCTENGAPARNEAMTIAVVPPGLATAPASGNTNLQGQLSITVTPGANPGKGHVVAKHNDSGTQLAIAIEVA